MLSSVGTKIIQVEILCRFPGVVHTLRVGTFFSRELGRMEPQVGLNSWMTLRKKLSRLYTMELSKMVSQLIAKSFVL
jgi:hypothetical protein